MTIKNRLRAILPPYVLIKLKIIINFWRNIVFLWEFGFYPPPQGTDLVGYETLIRFIQAKNILDIPGDIVEVGVFCGGGTYKLAKYLLSKKSNKLIYAIDLFNVSFDKTETTDGTQMAAIYERKLNGRGQYDIFSQVIKRLTNIITIIEDSKKVLMPVNSICFAFIDGNHSPDYVENDFYLVWGKLYPGGVVGFHDYGYDLPKVTATIDKLYTKHLNEITNRYIDNNKYICYFQKSSNKIS